MRDGITTCSDNNRGWHISGVGDTEALSGSAVGGAANEAGAGHRAGVAAYLAVYCLLAQPLHQCLPQQRVPKSVALEADNAVDDIVVRCRDGSSLFLQAKSNLSRGGEYRAALAQFVRAVRQGEVAEGDRLVLVARTFSGPLGTLGKALDRRQQPVAARPSKAEQEALAQLRRDDLPNDVTDDEWDRLVETMSLWTLEAECGTDSGFREASVLLTSAFVEHGHGPAALTALQKEAHRRAGRRYGATLDDWIDALRAAQVPLHAALDGNAAAARFAVLDALTKERDRTAADRDILTMALPARGVDSVDVPGLLEGFLVEVGPDDSDERDRLERTHPWRHVARRWGRLVLVGLPGGGKSTAMRQLAAHWARDPEAPFPLVVAAKRLAVGCRERGQVTLREILTAGLRVGTDPDMRAAVIEELALRANAGQVAVFLDGLDECGAQKARVVRSLAQELRPDAPLLVSCRRSALESAAPLGLSPVELRDPVNVTSALHALVTRIAEVAVAEAARDEWLAERRAWLEDTFVRPDSILRVPILATLVTLLACQRGPLRMLPTTRASLLDHAIHASTTAWEGARDPHPETYVPPLPVERRDFEAAFVLIGHAITEGNDSHGAVRNAVSEGLAAQLGVRTGRDDTAAEEAIRHWDEVVGVFPLDDELGVHVARNQVFLDIAEARWVAGRASTEEKRAWLDRLVQRGEGRSEAVALAAELDPDIVDAIVARTDLYPHAGPLMALLRALENGAPLREASAERLVNHLEHAIKKTEAAGLDTIDLRWKQHGDLAGLALPPTVRPRRDAILARLNGDDAVLADALTTISDATADARALTTEDRKRIRAALRLPIPGLPSQQPALGGERPVSHAGGSGPPRAGHVKVALVAARHLRPLADGEAAAIAAICRRSDHRIAPDIAFALERAGHGLPGGLLGRLRDQVHETVHALGQRLDSALTAFLTAAEALTGESPPRKQPYRCWQQRDLADLAQLVGIVGVVPDLFALAVEPALLVRMLGVLVDVAGDLDRRHVAEQARMINDRSWPEAGELLFIPSDPRRRTALYYTDALSRHLEALLDWVLTAPDAYAALAAEVLVAGHADDAVSPLAGQLAALPPYRRSRVALLLLDLDRDAPEMRARRWLSGHDDALRWAAARWWAQHVIADDDSELAALARDPDDTVRGAVADRALQPSAPAASYWSCPDCATRNPMTEPNCTRCHQGPHEPTIHR